MNRRKIHPGDVIQGLMTQFGIRSGNELAQKSGVPQPTIRRILNKESADPENETLERIARVFKLRVAHLRGEMTIEQSGAHYNVTLGPDVFEVREVSSIQAGRPQQVEDHFAPGDGRKVIYTTRRVSPNAYALRITGDSMENPNGGRPTFPDGCVVIVDPNKAADVGSFVAVRFDDVEEATFKQLVVDAGQQFLKPLNPRYPMIPLSTNASLCGTWIQTIIDAD